MSETPWDASAPQYYHNSILPEWYRQDTDGPLHVQQRSASSGDTSYLRPAQAHSNGSYARHPSCHGQPVESSTACLPPGRFPHSQPPLAPSYYHLSHISSHGAPAFQSLHVESQDHRRADSMPNLNMGAATSTGPRYLFQQSAHEGRLPASSQVPPSQSWSVAGQDVLPLQAQPVVSLARANYDQHATFVQGQGQQPQSVQAFVSHAPSQHLNEHWQHEQPVALPSQVAHHENPNLVSAWQATSYGQPTYNRGESLHGLYGTEQEYPINDSSISTPYPHPHNQYEEATYSEPLYQLPHMQLPDLNGHLQSQSHMTQHDPYPPALVSTGMPLSHVEVGHATDPFDPSTSMSPVMNAMSNLATSAAPPNPPQDRLQQTSFYTLGEDERYKRSSLTSPSSGTSPTGYHMQIPFTPSSGQPSPAIGHMPQQSPNDYFADYPEAIYHVQGEFSASQYQPAVDTNAMGEQAMSGMTKKTHDKAGKAKRQTRQYEGVCNNCQKHFASITLRGLDTDFIPPYLLQYYCMTCAPDVLAVTPPTDTGTSKPDEKQKIKFNKKRIRPTDPSAPALCDVCQRPAAYGGPVPLELETELTFHTEVVCDHCSSRYTRCSDCGGGGGARCGVGKWRCKELFAAERKTCSLSHSRQSSVSSMQYSIMRIRDITPEEKPELLDKCRKVFELSLLSTLAVPEVLERGTARATTFADVEEKVTDGWEQACKAFEDDKEVTEGIRRYLGVRWSAPKPRKSTSASARRASEEKTAQLSSPDLSQDPAAPDQIIKSGMNVAGFVTAEWAMKQGTIFISISVPYSTGEQYEGAAHLINMLQDRARAERDEVLAEFEAAGRGEESASIPPIRHSFTMIFFTPDSKYMAFLESKRQLLPLERYLQKHPETDPKIFPPHRKIFIDDERLAGLSCIVRHLHPPTSNTPKGKAVKASLRNVPQRKAKQA